MKYVAVAMSVYRNDSPQFFIESMQSMLEQTYKHVDIYLNVDGPISGDLLETVKRYEQHSQVCVAYCPENKGLAYQLNDIAERVAKAGKYSFLARMDADDISQPTRLSKQVEYLERHKEVAVVGTEMIEINEQGNELFYKTMPHTHQQLLHNIVRRCPFNHPTVMFNLQRLNGSDIRYPILMNTQDYFLWIDLASKGYQFANLNEALLHFRVDNNFYKRRGVKKAVNDVKSRLYAMKKLKQYSLVNLLYIPALFFLRILPKPLKKIVYTRLR